MFIFPKKNRITLLPTKNIGQINKVKEKKPFAVTRTKNTFANIPKLKQKGSKLTRLVATKEKLLAFFKKF